MPPAASIFDCFLFLPAHSLAITGVLFVAIVGGIYDFNRVLPTGFIPAEDQGMSVREYTASERGLAGKNLADDSRRQLDP